MRARKFGRVNFIGQLKTYVCYPKLADVHMLSNVNAISAIQLQLRKDPFVSGYPAPLSIQQLSKMVSMSAIK